MLNLLYLLSSKKLGDKMYLLSIFFLIECFIMRIRSVSELYGMRSREVNNAIPIYRNIIGALYLRVAANPAGKARSEFKWA